MAIVIEQSIVSDATKEHVSLKLVCGSVFGLIVPSGLGLF